MTAKALVKVYDCSVRVACEVVGLAPSMYYYHLRRSDESRLCADLERAAGQYPT